MGASVLESSFRALEGQDTGWKGSCRCHLHRNLMWDPEGNHCLHPLLSHSRGFLGTGKRGFSDHPAPPPSPVASH